MKSILRLFSLSLALALVTISCEENENVKRNGSLSFSIGSGNSVYGRANESVTPAAVIITVKDQVGNIVFGNRKLNLISFGQSYITEFIELQVGSYQVASFIVVDASNEAIYAAPYEGSEKASLVENPLPIPFVVKESESTLVKPEVVKIEPEDVPEKFGYVSFGFDVVDGEIYVPIGIKVELTVGEITYLDVNATVTVTGYNKSDEVKWMKDYLFDGPAGNYIKVKAGYDYYIFSVNHFGINISQSVNGNDLLEGSAGEVPLTYVLAGETEAKKLKEYTAYMRHGNAAAFVPQARVKYDYDQNKKLTRMTFFAYNHETNSLYEDRYFDLEHSNGKVSRIKGYHKNNNQKYIEDIYSYAADGRVSKIQEINEGSGVNTTITFDYSDETRKVKMSYVLSNGNSLNYEFIYSYGNLIKDQTMRWGTLCSVGDYKYESSINPFSHLGYVDTFLSNISINNRSHEAVQYLNCAFPTLEAERFTYELTPDGYPLSKTTHYKNSDFVGKTTFVY